MNAFQTWLDARLDEAPARLRRRLDGALRRTTAGARPSPGQLWVAAIRLMEEAKSSPTGPDSAASLLAADALVTLHVEWERGVAHSNGPDV